MEARVPTIVTGAMEHWPALTAPRDASQPDRRWSNVEYLRRMGGARTVPVELGSDYRNEEWQQQLMTLDEFIRQHVDTNEQQAGAAAATATATASSASPAAVSTSVPSRVGYLAQHRLFDQVPALRRDIALPDYCSLQLPSDADDAAGDDECPPDPQLLAWFGPCGTVSPLHHDPTHNLLAQVVGRKYVRLYAAAHGASLYPHASPLQNTSRIDAERIDEDKFPLATKLPYWEGILEPGSMLYIPLGCWHYIRSLSVSFSVSFWW